MREATLGADWLWWWVDEAADECFGMLVQAKRLHYYADWVCDLHASDGGAQMHRLFSTAMRFGVPPIYAIYVGPPSNRPSVGCGGEHTERDCARCHSDHGVADGRTERRTHEQ